MAYSSTHTEARPKAQSKQTQHCWPATPNIVGCCKRVVSVYTLGPVPCCCVLHGSCCAKFETGQTFSYVQTEATTHQQCWHLLRPFAHSLMDQ